jgi:hypothetical protein
MFRANAGDAGAAEGAPAMPAVIASSGRMPPAAMAAIGFAAFLLAAAVALWGYYGTAVFYEMILTGLAACF